RVSRKRLLADTRDRDVRAEKGGIENGWKNKQQSDQQHRQLRFSDKCKSFFSEGRSGELDERHSLRGKKYRVQAPRIPCTTGHHHSWMDWRSGSGDRERCCSDASRTGARARNGKSGRAASCGNRILEWPGQWNKR